MGRRASGEISPLVIVAFRPFNPKPFQAADFDGADAMDFARARLAGRAGTSAQALPRVDNEGFMI